MFCLTTTVKHKLCAWLDKAHLSSCMGLFREQKSIKLNLEANGANEWLIILTLMFDFTIPVSQTQSSVITLSFNSNNKNSKNV